MAIPAPSLTAGGINEMWIRQDWLDKLGLEVPRTWDEMAAVAEAFVTQGSGWQRREMIPLEFLDQAIQII